MQHRMLARRPTDIHPLFRDAFNRGDLEGLVALYQSDAILVVDGKNVTGIENLRKAFESHLARGGRMTLETLAVTELEGLAVLHGGWAIEPPTPMAAGLVTRGVSTEVVRRQPDGTWLFVIDNPYTPD